MRWLYLIALLAPPLAASRWELQYFHDENKSALTIVDLAFPSESRGVAVGVIDDDGRPRYVALITSDSGKTWSTVKLDEPPVSIFFLDESLGWLVTPGGIWETRESGRTWRRVKKTSGIRRVFFLNEHRGWAVGFPKAILETTDGGKTWSALKAAASLPHNPKNTTYHGVAFAGPQRGIIVGNSRPQRASIEPPIPDWVDPTNAAARRELPGSLIQLETRDGGESWKADSASAFGRVTGFRAAPDGNALLLLLFRDFFAFSSEVHSIDMGTGKSQRVFREKSRSVTDLAIFDGRKAYLAAVENAGALPGPIIPGKLKILKSIGLEKWEEMTVDYRAVGRRAILTGPDPDHLWAATDTGMILRLVP